MTDNEKKEFTFISEKVKKKPFYRSRWFLKGCQGIVLAIFFGGIAGATFAVVTPWAEKQFGEPDQGDKIVFISDETETEEAVETLTETEPVETTPATETEREVPPTIVEKKELEISDYKQLYSKMSVVADEAAKSIVTVTGESSNVDWLNEVIENQIQTAGLVIEIGRQDVFILTENRTIEDAQRVIVTFRDGTTADATIQKRDSISGLAVVKVPLASLEESTSYTIQKPELSSNIMVRQGDPVISLGSPVNNSNSVSFGMITSVVDTPTVDDEYRILTTDIIGNRQGSGILINLDGRIIGIIAQQFNSNDQITLTAMSFSDIKELVEALASNEEWTYMGITGKEITESVAEDAKMPQGIYISNIELDSPAMFAGILGGDILVSINGEEIHTTGDYVKELQNHAPEEIVKVGLKRSTLDGYADMEVLVTLGRK